MSDMLDLVRRLEAKVEKRVDVGSVVVVSQYANNYLPIGVFDLNSDLNLRRDLNLYLEWMRHCRVETLAFSLTKHFDWDYWHYDYYCYHYMLHDFLTLKSL